MDGELAVYAEERAVNEMHEGYFEEQKKEIEQVDSVELADIIMYNLRRHKGYTLDDIARLTKFKSAAIDRKALHSTTIMRHVDRMREIKGEVVLSRMTLKRLYEQEMKTPEEIAEILSIGQRTVYRKLKEYKMLKPRDRDNAGRFVPFAKKGV